MFRLYDLSINRYGWTEQLHFMTPEVVSRDSLHIVDEVAAILSLRVYFVVRCIDRSYGTLFEIADETFYIFHSPLKFVIVVIYFNSVPASLWFRQYGM